MHFWAVVSGFFWVPFWPKHSMLVESFLINHLSIEKTHSVSSCVLKRSSGSILPSHDTRPGHLPLFSSELPRWSRQEACSYRPIASPYHFYNLQQPHRNQGVSHPNPSDFLRLVSHGFGRASRDALWGSLIFKGLDHVTFRKGGREGRGLLFSVYPSGSERHFQGWFKEKADNESYGMHRAW